MIRFSLALVFAIVGIASAQDAKPRIFKPVRSPEILADGRVVFRFYAPNAQKVSLKLDGQDLAIAKDERGVWSATADKLPPDFYSYFFVVDGVQLGDPANPLLKPIVTGGSESLLHIPGPANLSWEENDVPHGILHRHRYHSRIVGESREFLVYTPPGYSPQKRYPTLYLLHGVMEDETAWTNAGRAHVILDNLIAAKRAKPMVLVMPLGYGFPNVPDRVGDVLTGKANHREDTARLADMLQTEIRPLVETNYRVGTRREDRALAGLSMGGMQALSIGLAHPRAFGSVASFSGAFPMFGSSPEGWFPQYAGKQTPHLLIVCGAGDFLLGSNRKVGEWLKAKKVPFKAIESPGNHTWSFWRRNLTDYLPTLF